MGTFCVPGSDLIWILTRRNTISDGKPVISEIKLPPCTLDITWAPFSDINIKPGSPNALPISSPNTTFTSFDHIMLYLTHLFFLYIEVVGMKNKKLTADQISSPASTSVIWQKPCVNSKAVDWKNKQTNNQNYVNKIASEERSQGVAKTVHSELVMMIPNPHLQEYLIPPFFPLTPPIANQNLQAWFWGAPNPLSHPRFPGFWFSNFPQTFVSTDFFFSSWNQRGLIW